MGIGSLTMLLDNNKKESRDFIYFTFGIDKSFDVTEGYNIPNNDNAIVLKEYIRQILLAMGITIYSWSDGGELEFTDCINFSHFASAGLFKVTFYLDLLGLGSGIVTFLIITFPTINNDGSIGIECAVTGIEEVATTVSIPEVSLSVGFSITVGALIFR